MPKASLRSLSENDLAAFQSLQTGNDCGLHALSAAIRLLCDAEIPPRQLIEETNRLWWQGRFFRVFPSWAITPQQLALLTNFLAKHENLPISAQVLHLSTQVLQNLIADESLACLVTIYWLRGKAPSIYHWQSAKDVNEDRSTNAHTMLLAAYDPTHFNGKINTPWGFINSWADRSSGLFWMGHEAFDRSWGFPLPVIGKYAAVVISRNDQGTAQ
ncbi:MAG TPA: hypothetical protein VLR89_03395 [Anaerolineaceae bacterium]|nr:hypothetical protein [Anaerolineaceae bacterium]